MKHGLWLEAVQCDLHDQWHKERGGGRLRGGMFSETGSQGSRVLKRLLARYLSDSPEGQPCLQGDKLLADNSGLGNGAVSVRGFICSEQFDQL